MGLRLTAPPTNLPARHPEWKEVLEIFNLNIILTLIVILGCIFYTVKRN